MIPDVPDPTLYAVPFFLASLALEIFVARRMRRAGKDLLGYEDVKDTFASLAMGIGSIAFVAPVSALVFWLGTILWPFRIVDLGEGALGWTAALIGWDLAYYWNHRFEHEVRLLWAAHVNHHSSQKYNLSTALRQPWTPYSSALFYPPLALLGISPWLILFSGGINLVYQFWVHTEVIGKLPTPIEYVFNTASHHRVHHGSNGRYLDKNYGGILIVWDRLFGTFEEEHERVVYGLTKNIATYNPIRIAFHEYAAIGKDLLRARSLRDVVGYVFGPPGWGPGRR
jgi:sterol desaturase/sphingolipid hydroxylase (fatty acid hydroxylase superfamily)